MKILFVTQFLPFPPDTGGKIKTWEILQILAKKHQVFLISFVEKKEDLRWEEKIKKGCFGLKTFVTPIITTSHQRLKLRALLGVLSPKPFRVQKYFLKETAQFVSQLTKKEDFDIVWCDHETSFQYLPFVCRVKEKIKIYDEHNISSEGLFQATKFEKNPITKFAYLWEGLRFYFYEKAWLKKFDKILTISREDKRTLIKRGIEKVKIKFLPIPFEVEPVFRYGSKNILFIGLLSWWPNNDAVLWFYQKIYPKIREKVPDVKFFVVGTNPSWKIQKIGKRDPLIAVTGYVKDIVPCFKKAGVFVAPIRAGSGVRVKILDALAAGLPVVATKIAASGIEVKDQRNILLADNGKEFAQGVIKILNDEKLACGLSQNGTLFMRRNYCHEEAEKVLTWVLCRKRHAEFISAPGEILKWFDFAHHLFELLESERRFD